MRTNRRRPDFTDALKAHVVKRAIAGESVKALAKEYKTYDSVIYTWKRNASKGAVTTNKADGRMELWVNGERAQLLQLIGELTLEVARMKRVR